MYIISQNELDFRLRSAPDTRDRAVWDAIMAYRDSRAVGNGEHVAAQAAWMAVRKIRKQLRARSWDRGPLAGILGVPPAQVIEYLEAMILRATVS